MVQKMPPPLPCADFAVGYAPHFLWTKIRVKARLDIFRFVVVNALSLVSFMSNNLFYITLEMNVSFEGSFCRSYLLIKSVCGQCPIVRVVRLTR